MENVDRYKEALLNPEIPFKQLRELDPLPEYLYKYVRFDENSYWKNYVEGKYHLSRPKVFEDDPFDCKPDICSGMFINGLKDISQKFHIGIADNLATMLEMINDTIIRTNPEIIKLNKELEAQYERIKNNFREKFRIGCFTSLFDDLNMWEEYAAGGKGFIIEYHTRGNEIFNKFMHRVIYDEDKYDVSSAMAIMLLVGNQQHIEISRNQCEYMLQKVNKVTMACSYVKQKKWEKEKEYRLTIPPYVVDANGMIKNTKYVINKNDDISLMEAIDKIYIRRTTKDLPDYKEKMTFIGDVSEEINIEIEYIN